MMTTYCVFETMAIDDQNHTARVRCRNCGLSVTVPFAHAERTVAHCASPGSDSPTTVNLENEDSPDLSRPDAPSFLTKVKNFAAAAASHVAAGMPMASDEEIIRRHDICLQCEHLVNDACNLCGCPVSRAKGYVSKLSWADQECPAGKWGKADIDHTKATG